jgi:hypothetical protein
MFVTKFSFSTNGHREREKETRRFTKNAEKGRKKERKKAIVRGGGGGTKTSSE